MVGDALRDQICASPGVDMLYGKTDSGLGFWSRLGLEEVWSEGSLCWSRFAGATKRLL